MTGEDEFLPRSRKPPPARNRGKSGAQPRNRGMARPAPARRAGGGAPAGRPQARQGRRGQQRLWIRAIPQAGARFHATPPALAAPAKSSSIATERSLRRRLSSTDMERLRISCRFGLSNEAGRSMISTLSAERRLVEALCDGFMFPIWSGVLRLAGTDAWPALTRPSGLEIGICYPGWQPQRAAGHE